MEEIVIVNGCGEGDVGGEEGEDEEGEEEETCKNIRS